MGLSVWRETSKKLTVYRVCYTPIETLICGEGFRSVQSCLTAIRCKSKLFCCKCKVNCFAATSSYLKSFHCKMNRTENIHKNKEYIL